MTNKGFKISFDKNTIDHLGIKLYSSFPPVIVEMISNAYDADAENVEISIDYGAKMVTITDDGNGMSHDELNENYLLIGRNRRLSDKTDLSRNKGRKVTGKKGLGKLAVFGIAKTIEVVSVKNQIKNGFSINYDELKRQNQGEYYPTPLFNEIEVNEKNFTQITIKSIKQKTIMGIQELSVSLARRFRFFDAGFKVILKDATTGKTINLKSSLFFDSLDKEFVWEFPKDFESEIKQVEAFSRLVSNKVNGKVYTKSTPLQKKDAGFLLYARNKLASENIFFDDRANDTFNSYVTGFFNVDHIDDSHAEDLISTARQSILWEENDEISQLKKDLNKIISNVSNQWREKRKKKIEEQLSLDSSFYEGLSPVEATSIKNVKNTLLKNITEIDDIAFVKRVLENMKTMYKFESFQSYIENLQDKEFTLENLKKIADDWELIEAKELAKIATGRISAIKRFETYIENDAGETKVIQPFLEKFPWLLDPRITTFEREITFGKILKENFPEKELEESNRRLDFLCNLVNGELIIIELKRPRIKITQKEIDQARAYERFILKHHKESVEKGIKTYLISDRYDMSEETKDIYESLEKDGKLYIKSYSDLLAQAKQYNKEFIKMYEIIREAAPKKSCHGLN